MMQESKDTGGAKASHWSKARKGGKRSRYINMQTVVSQALSYNVGDMYGKPAKPQSPERIKGFQSSPEAFANAAQALGNIYYGYLPGGNKFWHGIYRLLQAMDAYVKGVGPWPQIPPEAAAFGYALVKWSEDNAEDLDATAMELAEINAMANGGEEEPEPEPEEPEGMITGEVKEPEFASSPSLDVLLMELESDGKELVKSEGEGGGGTDEAQIDSLAKFKEAYTEATSNTASEEDK